MKIRMLFLKWLATIFGVCVFLLGIWLGAKVFQSSKYLNGSYPEICLAVICVGIGIIYETWFRKK